MGEPSAANGHRGGCPTVTELGCVDGSVRQLCAAAGPRRRCSGSRGPGSGVLNPSLLPIRSQERTLANFATATSNALRPHLRVGRILRNSCRRLAREHPLGSLTRSAPSERARTGHASMTSTTSSACHGTTPCMRGSRSKATSLGRPNSGSALPPRHFFTSSNIQTRRRPTNFARYCALGYKSRGDAEFLVNWQRDVMPTDK